MRNSELMGQAILVTRRIGCSWLARVALNSDHNPNIPSTNDYFIPRAPIYTIDIRNGGFPNPFLHLLIALCYQ